MKRTRQYPFIRSIAGEPDFFVRTGSDDDRECCRASRAAKPLELVRLERFANSQRLQGCAAIRCWTEVALDMAMRFSVLSASGSPAETTLPGSSWRPSRGASIMQPHTDNNSDNHARNERTSYGGMTNQRTRAREMTTRWIARAPCGLRLQVFRLSQSTDGPSRPDWLIEAA